MTTFWQVLISLATPNRGSPILRVSCEGWEAQASTSMGQTRILSNLIFGSYLSGFAAYSVASHPCENPAKMGQPPIPHAGKAPTGSRIEPVELMSIAIPSETTVVSEEPSARADPVHVLTESALPHCSAPHPAQSPPLLPRDLPVPGSAGGRLGRRGRIRGWFLNPCG
jgi:hypothetical protein